jgi:hypothetical protein
MLPSVAGAAQRIDLLAGTSFAATVRRSAHGVPAQPARPPQGWLFWSLLTVLAGAGVAAIVAIIRRV